MVKLGHCYGLNGICQMVCKYDHWLDWQIGSFINIANWYLIGDPHLQRCNHVLCKDGLLISCSTCWSYSDIFTDFNNWPGKISFSQSDFNGIDTTIAFTYEYTLNYCKMNCQSGYFWQNHTPTNPLTQRCVQCSLTCSTCVDYYNKCTSCWQASDISSWSTFIGNFYYLQNHL